MRGVDVTDGQIAHAKAFCESVGVTKVRDDESGIIRAAHLYRLMAWYRAVGVEAARKNPPILTCS